MYNEGGYIVNKELLKRYLEIANRYDGEFSLEEFLLYTTYKVQDIFSLDDEKTEEFYQVFSERVARDILDDNYDTCIRMNGHSYYAVHNADKYVSANVTGPLREIGYPTDARGRIFMPEGKSLGDGIGVINNDHTKQEALKIMGQQVKVYTK
jgi:hypothetical protein